MPNPTIFGTLSFLYFIRVFLPVFFLGLALFLAGGTVLKDNCMVHEAFMVSASGLSI